MRVICILPKALNKIVAQWDIRGLVIECFIVTHASAVEIIKSSLKVERPDIKIHTQFPEFLVGMIEPTDIGEIQDVDELQEKGAVHSLGIRQKHFFCCFKREIHSRETSQNEWNHFVVGTTLITNAS